MNFQIAYNLQFRTEVCGQEFLSDVYCADDDAARKVCEPFEDHPQQVDLVAAQVFIDTTRPDRKGCVVLDEESDKLFSDICATLRVKQGSFLNSKIGSYDELNNVIVPANLGHHFPDATMRVVWRDGQSAQSLDDTVRILKGAAQMLAAMQEIGYFGQTAEEFEAVTYEGVVERRTLALFEAGFWPDEDNEFTDSDASAVAEILNRRRVTA
jgi:hypothetical protein